MNLPFGGIASLTGLDVCIRLNAMRAVLFKLRLIGSIFAIEVVLVSGEHLDVPVIDLAAVLKTLANFLFVFLFCMADLAQKRLP